MSANQATFPIAAMARVLGVSEAGYHAWRKRPPSKKQEADTTLLKRVRTIHASSRETYGAPRVHAELRAGGGKHGRKRIARLFGILVRAPLPRAVWIAEVDVQVSVDPKPCVLRHLCPLIPRQRSSQLFRQAGDRACDAVAHGFSAMSS